MHTRLFLSLTLALSLIFAAHNSTADVRARQQQGRKKVSLVLFNGKIFTSDARGTIVEAVAIDGERIVAVGTSREIGSAYDGARAIDLKGKFVTPGFNDAHLHFLNGGLSLTRVDLNGAKTLNEAKRRVAARASEVQPGAWILGRGWDHTLWGGQWPTRQDLDEVAPRNPVFLQRVDGHVSWANTAALKLANVTRETKTPEGGEILRDAASGEPTGILKETAGAFVSRVVPEPSRAEKLEGITRALAEARRYGITSVQDSISGYDTLALYRELLAADKLNVRVAEWLDFSQPIAELKRQRDEFASLKVDPFRIRITALKGYVDGTLGSHTSAMLAPFNDDPHNSGIPRMSPEQLTSMIVERDAAGFQIALHAIGDRANRMALNGFQQACKERMGLVCINTESEMQSEGIKVQLAIAMERSKKMNIPVETFFVPRHRIEHAQVVAPTDFARFRDLGVIASMQPSHAISDKRWADDRLGEYRVQGAYAWHTMKAYGVHTAFGTDWPIEPINPYLGLYAAVTRQSTDGDPAGGWWPQQRVTIEDAIRDYTTESAYASFEEKDKGQIAAGMLADLCVHTRDLLTIKPEEILQTEAAITIFNGRVIYER